MKTSEELIEQQVCYNPQTSYESIACEPSYMMGIIGSFLEHNRAGYWDRAYIAV